jgi:hypothetical protein
LRRAATQLDVRNSSESLGSQNRFGVFFDRRSALDSKGKAHRFRVYSVEFDRAYFTYIDAAIFNRGIQIQARHRFIDERQI